jgi:hypothetical protein
MQDDLARFNAGASVDVVYVGRRAGRVFLEKEKMPSVDERTTLKTIVGWTAEGVHSINYVHPDRETSSDPTRWRRVRPSTAEGELGPARDLRTVDDLAGSAVCLAGRASDYVSGTVPPVDCGWLG